MIDDYWGPAKRVMSDAKFIENISSFDKDNIPAKTAKLVRDKYLTNAEMNPEKTKSTVAAIDIVSRALYRWVVIIHLCPKNAHKIVKVIYLKVNYWAKALNTLQL